MGDHGQILRPKVVWPVPQPALCRGLRTLPAGHPNMAGVDTVKINMDDMRCQMTGALNHLGRDLVELLITLPEDEREDLMDAFKNLAGYVGGLNCLYMDNDPQFNDVSGIVTVMDIYEAIGDEG